MTLKTYCTEEMVALECNEWVPADVARELVCALEDAIRIGGSNGVQPGEFIRHREILDRVRGEL